jgi:hypothetical protein
MRHILALSAVLAFAGVCLAVEFKSDEAKEVQADYTAALEAAKAAYGHSLAKAKANIDAKAAAATDAISKEALQSESAAITDELVKLRDADTVTLEPKEWKGAETAKARAAYLAGLKASQMKYILDLNKVRQAVLAKKAGASDPVVKEALQAEVALMEEEQARLKEGGKGAGARSGKKYAWTDLLALVDLSKDVIKGDWKRAGAGYAVAGGDFSTMVLPVSPAGDYELEFGSVRAAGGRGVRAILPVGKATIMLIIGGWDNKVSGLDMVNKQSAENNETTVKPWPNETGRPCAFKVRVTQDGDKAAIAVTLDGKPYISWSGLSTALGITNNWAKMGERSLAIGAHQTQATFSYVRLRMLSGEAKPLRPQS